MVMAKRFMVDLMTKVYTTYVIEAEDENEARRIVDDLLIDDGFVEHVVRDVEGYEHSVGDTYDVAVHEDIGGLMDDEEAQNHWLEEE